ncbi:MAG TPA: division plane positioning ATPase MipZ [Rhizomicrobium sp.]|nr:division plane positioning ATPase MipZ [Rhizomicrobium sp.]
MSAMNPSHAQFIVFGNEKGGSGKTTAAMHVAVALAQMNKRVGVIDLDIRQRSFSRQIENRIAWKERSGSILAMPEQLAFSSSCSPSLDTAAKEEADAFTATIAGAQGEFDFVVVDTPGANTHLSRLAHAAADILVTPLNDSFVDFDLLATIDAQTYAVSKPSLYSDFVWECRKRRLLARKPALDWIVMRNRLTATDAKNKRRMSAAVEALARRIGFRVAPGFGERVIYRELFPAGLTVLDLPQPRLDISLSLSHLAARQEVRALISALTLPLREPAAQAQSAA